MSARGLAWTIWGLTIAVTFVGLGLLLASLDAPVPDSWGFRGFTSLFAVTFSTVGALILSRRSNAVGWILLLAGLFSGLQVFGEEYAIYGLLWHPGQLPAAIYVAWYGSWIWAIVVSGVAIYLPLLFPDGRITSRSGRVVAIVAAVDLVVLVGGLALRRGPLNNSPFADNPLGLIDLKQEALILPFFGVMIACALAATLTVVARYRRARGAERQQIKWLAYGFGVLVVGMAIAQGTQQTKPGQYALIAAMLAVPLTAGVAIRRYRLYDVDALINRTLVYGAVSASLAATYLAAVLLLQTALRPFTSGSEIAVAASTLVVVALFQPVRRRVQDAVDRAFYRSRYDAARTLDAFSVRLRDTVELEAVRADVLDVVTRTVAPAHADLWLRGSDR